MIPNGKSTNDHFQFEVTSYVQILNIPWFAQIPLKMRIWAIFFLRKKAQNLLNLQRNTNFPAKCGFAQTDFFIHL